MSDWTRRSPQDSELHQPDQPRCSPSIYRNQNDQKNERHCLPQKMFTPPQNSLQAKFVKFFTISPLLIKWISWGACVAFQGSQGLANAPMRFWTAQFQNSHSKALSRMARSRATHRLAAERVLLGWKFIVNMGA
jgi:hypothetical protein